MEEPTDPVEDFIRSLEPERISSWYLYDVTSGRRKATGIDYRSDIPLEEVTPSFLAKQLGPGEYLLWLNYLDKKSGRTGKGFDTVRVPISDKAAFLYQGQGEEREFFESAEGAPSIGHMMLEVIKSERQNNRMLMQLLLDRQGKSESPISQFKEMVELAKTVRELGEEAGLGSTPRSQVAEIVKAVMGGLKDIPEAVASLRGLKDELKQLVKEEGLGHILEEGGTTG